MPGQKLEAFDAGRAFDNLDAPGATTGDGAAQLLAAVDPVGKDMGQLGEGLPQRAQQRHGAVRVLDIGRMDLGGEDKALRVGHDMRLRPLMRLPASTPRGPPLSVVDTLWLSIMPAEGTRSRPACWRARATSARLIRSQSPSSRQR